MPKKIEDITPSMFSVFMPTSARSIKIDYPELKEYESLKVLSNDEYLFVWYFACESSPFFKIASDRKRCEKALSYSFNKTEGKHKVFGELLERYLSGRFPEKISSAISDMKNFKLGPRVRFKMMAEKVMSNFEKILDIDASDTSHFLNKDGEVDFTKKKAYVDTATKAMESAPMIIKSLETGFGVKEIKKMNDQMSTIEGTSLIDEFHEKEY